MPIDFSAPANRDTYGGRDADASWRDAVRSVLDPAGLDVADVGCGAGVYSRACSELGAASVVGVDSSAVVLSAAEEEARGSGRLRFVLGDAAATTLPGASVDVVFERALVHHISDLAPVVAEARRLLRPGGAYLVQDRTPDDVAVPGSPDHPRGWFFEVFPRLLEIENGRRRSTEALTGELTAGGFPEVTTASLEEVRRRYASPEDYLAEIRTRTGRSILHDLDDDELDHLVGELRRRLPAGPLTERDRWTFWAARRPSG